FGASGLAGVLHVVVARGFGRRPLFAGGLLQSLRWQMKQSDCYQSAWFGTVLSRFNKTACPACPATQRVQVVTSGWDYGSQDVGKTQRPSSTPLSPH
ncbi:hypothetical protein COCVIDRAFT_95573, partial [Bipolaris victoriae FI3]